MVERSADVAKAVDAAFADAVNWKYLSENPVIGAARIRQERKGHNVWTPDQLRPFLLTAKDERLYAELGRYMARLDDERAQLRSSALG
jgi:hypothetical protein